MYKLLITIILLTLTGCTTIGNLIPPSQQKAISLEPTEIFADLKNLPKPMGSIPVSVYSFRDQTGQYKPQTNVSSFSTAVTQGANSILIQALHESDWFTPVEREGLQNILTERKIIRAAQSENANRCKVRSGTLTTGCFLLMAKRLSHL